MAFNCDLRFKDSCLPQHHIRAGHRDDASNYIPASRPAWREDGVVATACPAIAAPAFQEFCPTITASASITTYNPTPAPIPVLEFTTCVAIETADGSPAHNRDEKDHQRNGHWSSTSYSLLVDSCGTCVDCMDGLEARTTGAHHADATRVELLDEMALQRGERETIPTSAAGIRCAKLAACCFEHAECG